MKTTLDLPDDLMRTIKVRAAREDRKLKDLIAQLLRQSLAMDAHQTEAPRRRVELPLVHCAHGADPDREMSPDQVSEILLAEEARSAGYR
jgi:hypothetical protein